MIEQRPVTLGIVLATLLGVGAERHRGDQDGEEGWYRGHLRHFFEGKSPEVRETTATALHALLLAPSSCLSANAKIAAAAHLISMREESDIARRRAIAACDQLIFYDFWRPFEKALATQEGEVRTFAGYINRLLLCAFQLFQESGFTPSSEDARYNRFEWLVIELLARGDVRMAEALIRFFGWSGAFGSDLIRSTPDFNYSHGDQAHALYKRLFSYFGRAVELAVERKEFGVAAALCAYYSHRNNKALDTSSAGWWHFASCAAKAKQADQPIALDIRDACHFYDDGDGWYPGKRPEQPRRYMAALGLWKHFFKEEPRDADQTGGAWQFAGIEAPRLVVGDDTYYFVSTAHQSALILLLAEGRWLEARLLCEWFGWSGAFTASLERHGKRRYGFGHQSAPRASRALLRFALPAMQLALKLQNWGVAAALGQLALLEHRQVRKSEASVLSAWAKLVADEEFKEREADLTRRIREATLITESWYDHASNSVVPEVTRPTPPELVVEEATLKEAKEARVLRIVEIIMRDIHRALAAARESGQIAALDIFD